MKTTGDALIKAKAAQEHLFREMLSEDRGLNACAIKIGVLLMSKFYNRERKCAWPSVITLAARLSYSERHITRAINILEARSWFTVLRRAGPVGQNVYIPNFEKLKGREADEPSDRQIPHLTLVSRSPDTNVSNDPTCASPYSTQIQPRNISKGQAGRKAGQLPASKKPFSNLDRFEGLKGEARRLTIQAEAEKKRGNLQESLRLHDLALKALEDD